MPGCGAGNGRACWPVGQYRFAFLAALPYRCMSSMLYYGWRCRKIVLLTDHGRTHWQSRSKQRRNMFADISVDARA